MSASRAAMNAGEAVAEAEFFVTPDGRHGEDEVHVAGEECASVHRRDIEAHQGEI